jgi:hypothetical protein
LTSGSADKGGWGSGRTAGLRACASGYNKKSFIYCPGGKTLIWRKSAAPFFRYKGAIGRFPKATNDKVTYG